MAKFKVGNYLLRIDDDRNIIWRVHKVKSSSYILTVINHYNYTVFPVGSDHPFSFMYVESYYKPYAYEKILAKVM